MSEFVNKINMNLLVVITHCGKFYSFFYAFAKWCLTFVEFFTAFSKYCLYPCIFSMS